MGSNQVNQAECRNIAIEFVQSVRSTTEVIIRPNVTRDRAGSARNARDYAQETAGLAFVRLVFRALGADYAFLGGVRQDIRQDIYQNGKLSHEVREAAVEEVTAALYEAICRVNR